jgi:Spy/CpxP family protein refolding chaperone
MSRILQVLFLVACASATAASHAQPSPYAGEQARTIKALSDQEIKQYLSGAGMGYAKAAELNSYPGPMHALELADRLELTSEQRMKMQALMDSHKKEARAIGATLVAAERELDLLFRSRHVERGSLESAVRAAAESQALYRLSHLDSHRRMKDLLTAEQVARYDALRGYAGDPATQHPRRPAHE